MIAVIALGLAAVAIGVRAAGVEGALTFVIAAIALIGLAWLLGEATEQAGGTVGPRASALLNASFGNLPEIVIVILAINAGLNDIARASIIGSVVGQHPDDPRASPCSWAAGRTASRSSMPGWPPPTRRCWCSR